MPDLFGGHEMGAAADYAATARGYCDQLGDPSQDSASTLIGMAQVEASLAQAAATDRLAAALERLADTLAGAPEHIPG